MKPASEAVGVRAQLLALIDELLDATLEEVKNLAEFLRQKRQKSVETAS